MDISSANKDLYKCIEVSDNKYTWTKLVSESSGENATGGGMSAAQINALHGMFQVVLFDDSKDVDGAISAFETAFGISDSGGDTGGGDSGGEDSGGDDSGGTTGDALPTDGLMAYFDLRNLGDKANVTVGTTKGVMATRGSGALYSWATTPITGSDEYGAVLPRGLSFNPNGPSDSYDMGDEFSVVVCTRAAISAWHMLASNVDYGTAQPVYVTADGTAKAAMTSISGDKTGYNTQVYCISGSSETMYLNAAKVAAYSGGDYDGFVKWEAAPTAGTTYGQGTTVAAAFYNRVLTETEIVEVQAFMKTLEVAA